MKQLMSVQLRFPDLDVDLTLLSSAEDKQVCRGGLAYIARRKADVSSVIRVRNCTDNQLLDSCDTVYIKDHRYQAAIFTTNAFRIVSVLRTIGQSYFCLRVVMLFASCYVTRVAEDRYKGASPWRRLRAAARLFARIPSQCVLCGSTVPICCYAVAHFIDGSMTYEMVAQAFTTSMGDYTFNATKFAFLAANQMRNVWFLAITMQILHWIIIGRRQWSASKGILGVPDFFLGVLSCLSMISQLRLLSLRDSRILRYYQVNARFDSRVDRFALSNSPDGNMLLEGAMLDAKFFMCLLVTLSVVFGVAHVYEWYQQRETHSTLLLPRMAVPYTAGTWWSTLAFSVSWGGTIYPVPKAYKLVLIALRRPSRFLFNRDDRMPSVSPQVSDMHTRWPRQAAARVKFFQQEMEHIHMRSPDIDSLTALINLVACSDPWIFFRLRLWRGHTVHYMKDTLSGKIFAVPAAAISCRLNSNIPWEDMVHVRSCNTLKMSWSDTIHVG
ncbi:TPA: hypothetical protein N0F65_006330 [Lagenidium giganteum]|uniref:Uncharacterized protein n=1 Tax=Lagenidium giganteum TaxID=4803 RepID=A0AAV2YPP9_9STRA|nr:TPA: hypothetical protein N0F65_006330 [Lagenidium giganteum]